MIRPSESPLTPGHGHKKHGNSLGLYKQDQHRTDIEDNVLRHPLAGWAVRTLSDLGGQRITFSLCLVCFSVLSCVILLPFSVCLDWVPPNPTQDLPRTSLVPQSERTGIRQNEQQEHTAGSKIGLIRPQTSNGHVMYH